MYRSNIYLKDTYNRMYTHPKFYQTCILVFSHTNYRSIEDLFSIHRIKLSYQIPYHLCIGHKLSLSSLVLEDRYICPLKFINIDLLDNF